MLIYLQSSKDFESIIKNNQLVLVDFFATWCGPCRMLTPVLEELEEERPDVTILKVNVDENQELAMAYRIHSIPTLMVFKNGQKVREEMGYRSKDDILEML